MTAPRVLRSTEVAALFRVDPKTVVRWALLGKLPGFQTPGGHWRFRETDVLDALNSEGP